LQGNSNVTEMKHRDRDRERAREDKERDSRIRDIFNHYLSKNIIQHKKITNAMRTAVKARLKDYSYEQLIEAIDNYSIIYHGGNKYWFDTKYGLADLMRDK